MPRRNKRKVLVDCYIILFDTLLSEHYLCQIKLNVRRTQHKGDALSARVESCLKVRELPFMFG